MAFQNNNQKIKLTGSKWIKKRKFENSLMSTTVMKLKKKCGQLVDFNTKRGLY